MASLVVHALKLGRTFLVASAGLLLLAVAGQAILPLNMMAVVLAAWLLQGLAVVHHSVAALGAGPAWLVLTYGALLFGALFASPVVVAVPVIGAADEVFDLRGRVTRARRGRGDRGDEE